MPRPAIPATSIMLTAEKKGHPLVGRDGDRRSGRHSVTKKRVSRKHLSDTVMSSVIDILIGLSVPRSRLSRLPIVQLANASAIRCNLDDFPFTSTELSPDTYI